MSRVLFLLAIASFRDAAVAATRARVEGPSAADLAVAKGARIIGGTRAEAKRYPYAVPVFINGHYGCSGALVGPDAVLTAAHCLRRGRQLTVGVGSHLKGESERIRVRHAEVHPSYDEDTDEHDVGVLFLARSAVSSRDGAAAHAFPRLNRDAAFPPPGVAGRAMGWGDTDEGADVQRVSEVLLFVDLRVISNEQCKQSSGGDVSYASWIYDDMLCTYTKGRDACQGDSGGPLVIPDGASGGGDVLVGLVSWGVGCNFLPGVFSRVSASYDWIQRVVCAESRDPPGALCVKDLADPSASNDHRMHVVLTTENHVPSTSQSPSASNSPTAQPSMAPSLRPSRPPTTSPTTAEPTSSPTASPTPAPSLSSRPTRAPSAPPTRSYRPTTAPSRSPSTTRPPPGRPSTAPSRGRGGAAASPSQRDAMSAPSGSTRKEDRTVPKALSSTPDDSIIVEEEASFSVGRRRGRALDAVLCGVIAALLMLP